MLTATGRWRTGKWLIFLSAIFLSLFIKPRRNKDMRHNGEASVPFPGDLA